MANSELIRKWVDALRSGKYAQGTEHLRIESEYPEMQDAYCCLGVACDLSGLGHFDGESYMGEYGVLPVAVQYFLGLNERNPEIPYFVANKYAPEIMATRLSYDNITLAELNDKGATFEQIADIIEAVFL